MEAPTCNVSILLSHVDCLGNGHQILRPLAARAPWNLYHLNIQMGQTTPLHQSPPPQSRKDKTNHPQHHGVGSGLEFSCVCVWKVLFFIMWLDIARKCKNMQTWGMISNPEIGYVLLCLGQMRTSPNLMPSHGPRPHTSLLLLGHLPQQPHKLLRSQNNMQEGV